jgi:hypothetical protein
VIEPGEKGVEVAAGESPLEGLGALLVSLLKADQAILHGGEVREVVWSEDFALDDAEVGFDLIEPTGVNWCVDEDDIRPLGFQAIDCWFPAIGGAVVHDPEDMAGGAIGFLAHDMGDEALRSGGLKALNVGYEPEGADLNIAYPRDPTSSAKLLALMRHLRLAFGSPPYWEIARGGEPG